MAVIDPSGLFNGDRLRRCSNAAQLHWPRLYLASDGFGRLEINYARIVGHAYSTFNPIPSETELQSFIQEFVNNFLLFPYEVRGQLWGQWDSRTELLPRYKTAADRRSPVPPEAAFSQWKQMYRTEQKAFPKSFGKISATFLHGGGVGGGVGIGIGENLSCASDAARMLVPAIDHSNTKDVLSEAKSITVPSAGGHRQNGTAHQAVLAAVATAIHARHPTARRDCGVGMVERQLTAILKHKRVPSDQRDAYLQRIDANHAGMCSSEQWTKDGGLYAKALSNYLAPTKERYDVEVNGTATIAPTTRLMA